MLNNRSSERIFSSPFHRSHIPLSRNLRPFLSMTEREPSLLSIAYFIVKISCRLLLLMGHPESSARSIIHRLSLRGSNDPPIHFSLRHSSERTAESIFRIHCSFCFLLECVFLNGSKRRLPLRVSWKFLGLFDRRAWVLKWIVRLGVTVTLIVCDEEGIFDEASRIEACPSKWSGFLEIR